MGTLAQSHKVHFDSFVVDLRAGEIYKHGIRLKLQDQPFRVFSFLLERPGQVVTREELRQRLWSADTFVDFDTGLNSAIKRLRDVLGDSADKPRYIETLPRRGYRFLGSPERCVEDRGFESPSLTQVEPTPETIHASKPKSVAPAKSARLPLRLLLASGLTLGALGLAVFFAFTAPGRSGDARVPIKSVAVLPLQNLSGDPSQEYFADGMTEALITDLAQISTLRVISRTSMMQYKGARKSLPEIARELKVDAIVEGSVQRSGGRVRITTELIDGESEAHLWARSFDRDLNDVLMLESEIAQAVTGGIQVKLTAADDARVTAPREPPVNPAAQDAYLKGRYLWNRRTGHSVDQSIQFYQQAIATDANWAAPWAAMADSYIVQESEGRIPTQQAGPIIAAAANKAVELDPNLADAHLVMGQVKEMQWNWTDAEKEYRRAIELNPGLARAHHWLSLLLIELNRPTEAISEIDRAVDLEPLSRTLYLVQSRIYYMARQYERAWRPLRLLKETEGDSAAIRELSGIVFLGQQMYSEAAAEFLACTKAEPNEPEHLAYLTYAYSRQGDHAKALHTYTRLQQLKNTRLVAPWWLAVAWVGLGKNDKAIEFLTAAYRMRSSAFPTILADPLLDPLRSDPRFQALLRQASMPSS